MLAAAANHEGVVRLLLDAGADVNASNARETALSLALAGEHEDIVALLRSVGATER